MKPKLLIIVICCLISAIKTLAQEKTGVEHVHSVKVNLIGVGYGYEHALSKRVALNTELMLSGGIGGSSIRPRNGGSAYFIFAPTLRVEPRFYYNYLKWAERGKKMLHNSSNFLALALENRFKAYLTNVEGKGTNLIMVIPKWGLRRIISQHFYFEGAIGVGASYSKFDKFQVVPGLDLRLGFAF